MSYLSQKNKIVMTAGSFDLAHYGHLKLLQKAKQLGDFLIVAVSTDKLIKQHKEMSPIISYRDRVAMIKALKCVDKVVKQTKLIDIEQFKALKADVYVIGSDWKDRTDNEGLNWLRDNDKVVFVPYTSRLSSSAIKEKIIANAIPIIRAQSRRKRNVR
jgi:glycerol-3-phosphate cytidylyltransferase